MRQNGEPLTISSLNALIRDILEGDEILSGLSVRGEISNFKVYPSGHCYFSLKDDQSVISCVMWGSYASYLRFRPKDGDEVLVKGKISVYPPRGSYQLSITHMELYGLGAELLRLKQLTEKLAKEGLFDPERKRPLPRFPKRVGVIAGKDSAGLRDIVVNLSNRWPLAELLIIPSLVQGKEAPAALMKAFDQAMEGNLDVLIIARGGGSSEDLSCFNDEALVRLVATSTCPVISAVGHEIDTTLIDLVADKRVSTPTAAAVAAVPDKNEIYQTLDTAGERLSMALEGKIKRLSERVALLAGRSFFLAPESLYARKRQELGETRRRLNQGMDRLLEKRGHELSSLSGILTSISPKRVLKRGYSISFDEKGMPIKNVASVKPGQTIKTQVDDGIITSTVTSKEETNG